METNTHIKKPDLKFIILFDFSNTSFKALDYLIKMAKVVNGSIHIFCITTPSEVITKENHISILKFINEKKEKTERQLESIIEMVKLEGITANFSISFGMIESDLQERFQNNTSTIAVLPQITSETIARATKFLMHQFTGNLLLINKFSKFDKELNIAMGCSKNTLKNSDIELPSHYCKRTNTSLAFVKFNEKSNLSSIIKGLKAFISSNQLNFICIGRSVLKKSFLNRLSGNYNTMNNLLTQSNIPILIMGEKR